MKAVPWWLEIDWVGATQDMSIPDPKTDNERQAAIVAAYQKKKKEQNEVLKQKMAFARSYSAWQVMGFDLERGA